MSDILAEIRISGTGLSEINGPLIFLKTLPGVGFDELVRIEAPDGRRLTGRVLQINKEFMIVEVFEGTSGLSLSNTKVDFLRTTYRMGVSKEMLGRIFSGLGEPMDKLPKPIIEEYFDINGSPMNPIIRGVPEDFIQTGISTIDCLYSLVRGQKLPIFSGAGLPHNQLTAQIVRQAEIGTEEDFVIVFIGMGIKQDDAYFFRKTFEKTGDLDRVVMFLNLAENPPMERLVTPRIGLTVAEYLAYFHDMTVLAIITDMTAYAEALKVISSSKGEIPSRKGYPGYLYSDFASIYERSGRIKGKKGSLTQIPILSMPSDDIGHPIPDISGYITEGQILLDRMLYNQGVYPPINISSSLSRLMKDGIGAGKTREDHDDVASQLYAAYAKVKDVESLASIIGESELTAIDRKYMDFGREFQDRFINQGEVNRSIEESLNLAWEILAILPESELTRIRDQFIQRYSQSAKT
jgi:V/A-type H+-transporting ATPase subunit B